MFIYHNAFKFLQEVLSMSSTPAINPTNVSFFSQDNLPITFNGKTTPSWSEIKNATGFLNTVAMVALNVIRTIIFPVVFVLGMSADLSCKGYSWASSKIFTKIEDPKSTPVEPTTSTDADPKLNKCERACCCASVVYLFSALFCCRSNNI
jgi:hypothetical protein